MWLFGPRGHNAKGTWARMIQSIICYDNCGNLSAEDLTGKNPFALATLDGKLSNICPEPNSDILLSAEILQSLTGGDFIDTKIKYVQNPLKLKNTAKITMMGNKYPQFKNPTAALYKRILICTFPNSYEKTEDANIEQIWLDDEESRSALLNWMIEGLQRLLQNEGRFTDNLEWEEKQRIFALSTDPLTKFIEQQVIFDHTSNITKNKLQEAADKYCSDNKVPPIDIKKSKLQQSAPYQINEKQIKIDIDGVKKPVWHWIGVRLKTKEEQEAEIQTQLSDTEPPPTEDTSTNTTESVTKVTEVTEKNKTLQVFSDPTSPYSTQRQLRTCGACAKYKQDNCRYSDGKTPPIQHPRFNENYEDSNYANECCGFKTPTLS